jgi:hypothetical protein
MNDQPLQRRHVLGALSVAGASLAASTANALPRGADEDFRRATRILQPYGIGIVGHDSGPYDLIATNIRPVAATAYTQTVKNARTDVLSLRTLVVDKIARFEHFHDVDGNPIPCIKTTIEDDALATHELFNDGALDPCVRVTAEMLDGAQIGRVDFEHLHEDDLGGIVPCVRTTIHDHELATHELFNEGALEPCLRVSAEMLKGARIGKVDFVHLHENDVGAYIPCVKTTIQDHELATHELFNEGAIIPCVRVSSEMLDGGKIGRVDFEHLHENRAGDFIPCIRTTIHDHELATHEIFDAARDGQVSLEVVTEMLEGGAIGAIDVLISDPKAQLTVRVGERTYVLSDGALIER